MENLIELKKEELIALEGGYPCWIGHSAVAIMDFFEGFAEGFDDGFVDGRKTNPF